MNMKQFFYLQKHILQKKNNIKKTKERMNMLEISGCIFLCEYLMWIILSIGYDVIFE